MTNLDCVLKSRDITFPTKVHVVKAIFFPVVMYRCQSCTTKKAEHQIINAFKLWCWRRLFRVPWMARRSNQSISKKMNLEYSLEGLMLKLKLQKLKFFGHVIWSADSVEKTLMLGKKGEESIRGWNSLLSSPIQWTCNWANSRSQWRTGEPDSWTTIRTVVETRRQGLRLARCLGMRSLSRQERGNVCPAAERRCLHTSLGKRRWECIPGCK